MADFAMKGLTSIYMIFLSAFSVGIIFVGYLFIQLFPGWGGGFFDQMGVVLIIIGSLATLGCIFAIFGFTELFKVNTNNSIIKPIKVSPPEDRLLKLKKLKDSGAITLKEFKEKKQELLDKI